MCTLPPQAYGRNASTKFKKYSTCVCNLHSTVNHKTETKFHVEKFTKMKCCGNYAADVMLRKKAAAEKFAAKGHFKPSEAFKAGDILLNLLNSC